MGILAACLVPHPPVILPEVGRGEEKKIQKTIDAYREVMRRVAALSPDTVVVASPHSVLYADYFHISPGKSAKGDLKRFGAGKCRVEADYDAEFAEALSLNAQSREIAAGTLGERDKSLDHGTLLPLHFLNEFLSEYKVVRMGLSGFSVLEHYRLGKCVAETSEQLGRRTVFIASGDLSHKLKETGPYSYAPEGPAFDREIVEIVETGDFLRLLSLEPALCDAAGECGYRSLVMLAGALDGQEVESELLSYEGPFGVGYGVGWFAPVVSGTWEAPGTPASPAAAPAPPAIPPASPTKSRRFDLLFEAQERAAAAERKAVEDAYVRLARLSLESRVQNGRAGAMPAQVAEELPEEMLRRKAGVFVSLKMYGQLRGCIGTIEATEKSVAQEIWRNAISAGLQDPRFEPITEKELPFLIYSVDVLGAAESIGSEELLDVKRYGVIVRYGQKQGLLLPNLEGVETPRQQVEIALQKAGIRPGEKYRLQRFEVVRHK